MCYKESTFYIIKSSDITEYFFLRILFVVPYVFLIFIFFYDIYTFFFLIHVFFMNHVVHITFMLRILFQKSSGFLWMIRVFIKQKKNLI